MAKKKYYAVKKGLTPGIYYTWEDCKKQVDGVTGAVYKGFETLMEADEFLGGEISGAGKKESPKKTKTEKNTVSQPMPELLKGQGIAYVDGSYNVSTGEYGSGAVLFYMNAEGEKKEEHISKKGEDAELASMRNVAGEILGARLAMERAVSLELSSLKIYHDYQGIASWCLGQWKTNKEGTRAYKEYFDSIQDKLQIDFVKVKGHSGDTFNDLADTLAKQTVFEVM